jgi:hypothetical protein
MQLCLCWHFDCEGRDEGEAEERDDLRAAMAMAMVMAMARADTGIDWVGLGCWAGSTTTSTTPITTTTICDASKTGRVWIQLTWY